MLPITVVKDQEILKNQEHPDKVLEKVQPIIAVKDLVMHLVGHNHVLKTK